MAVIMEGKRRIVRLSVEDVINIVREYQTLTRGCCCYEHVREVLTSNSFYVPEDK